MKTKVSVTIALGIVAAAIVLLSAQKPAVQGNLEMDRIYEQDQKDRQNFNKMTEAQLKQMTVSDAQRRVRVRQLLAAGELRSGLDFLHAAFVFQHGDTADDILLAHVLAMAAISHGDADAKWIAAATLDRYLQRKDTPQIFGTQYGWKDQGTNVHKWNQEPYDRDFLSDGMRREFCVSSYADQQLNLKALSEGKEPVSPDGCR